MKLSMIIPVFNEKKTLGELIRRVMAVSLPGVKKEIIIVDDKSTDSSRKVLGQIKKQSPQFKILYHQRNQGKGAAVRTGLKNATGDYVLIQMGIAIKVVTEKEARRSWRSWKII